MIKCPKCHSTYVQDTGVCKYSFPSYSVYVCLECGHKFDVCNNEEIPVITDEDYLRKKYPKLYGDKSNE